MLSRHGFGISILSVLALAACSGGGGGGGGATFALSVSGSDQQLTAGSSMAVPLEVSAPRALEEDVTLGVSGLPDGLTVTLARSAVREGSVTLTVTASVSLAPGSYGFVVTGTYRAEAIELPVTIQVVDLGYDFLVAASRQDLVLAHGEQVRTDVTAIPTRGALPPVAWSLENLPDGVTGAVDANGVLSLDAAESSPAGTYEVSVVAMADELRRARAVLLHVLPAREQNGLVVTAPCIVQVRRGGTTAAQIDIERALGVTGDVGLQLQGLPGGVSGVFGDNPAPGAASVLLLSCDPGAALGEWLVTVTATVGGSRGTAHLLLEVTGDGALPDARVQRLELAQAFFGRDPGLVGGRDALLRAHVVADAPGTPAPVVRVEGFDGGSPLGSLAMTGPATLPVGEAPEILAQSFTANLPSTWIAPGLRLVVTLDPDAQIEDREERNDRVELAPTVGSENRIDLVVVPLRLGGNEAQAGDYKDMLRATWPLTDVDISLRAPYTVTSVSSVSSDGTGWSSVLSEVAALRSADGSSAYYYGVVPVTYSSGVAGIGYLGAPISLGWNRSSSVLLHEIGHNFGLRHAPCGGASSPDTDYPFSGAVIGTWGFDQRSSALQDPKARRDLMSYCNPSWVSGYNFARVRERLASFSVESELSVQLPLLLVRGELDEHGHARLLGVHRAVGRAVEPAGGDLVLRLTSADGRTVERPVAALEIGCGADAHLRQFQAVVPDPGALDALEIVHAGRVVLREVAQRGGVAGASLLRTAPAVGLEERGGVLTVRWDAAAWPSLGLTHVGDRRTTLALGLSGGVARVPLRGVPSGGRFEVSVANGLDGAVFEVSR